MKLGGDDRLPSLSRRKQQVVLLGFIADFYCPRLNLVIEIDGGIHNDAVQYDQRRTKALESKGLSVIRFTNDEVNDDIEGVVRRIQNAIQTSV